MPEEYGYPYIPLSWLRHQRTWAREHVKGNCLDWYDLWLLTVRQEIDRLIILDLYKRIAVLERRYRPESDYIQYDYSDE